MKVAVSIAVAGARRSGKSWLVAKLSEVLVSHQITEVGAPLPDLSGFDVILLMGRDLIPHQAKLNAAQRLELDTQDQALRNALAGLGRPFHVVYGDGDTRLQNALSVIQPQSTMHSIAGYATDTRPAGQYTLNNSENWSWPCEKCSDPDCEHQLFSRLLQTAGSSL